MRRPFFSLVPLLLLGALAGCGEPDPTPAEGAAANAVEASVNNAEATLDEAEEKAENRAGIAAAGARGEALADEAIAQSNRAE